MSELKVGQGWRYECWKCQCQVKIDKPIPLECPGCGKTGWWGHLIAAGGNGKATIKIEDGNSIKGTIETASVGVRTRKGILSQLPDATVHGFGENNGVYGDTQGQKRGRPRQAVPEDLEKLSEQGLSSRQIAADLAARGFHISYKSIQRFLKRQKQGSLL